jgi:hypothetical protein
VDTPNSHCANKLQAGPSAFFGHWFADAPDGHLADKLHAGPSAFFERRPTYQIQKNLGVGRCRLGYQIQKILGVGWAINYVSNGKTLAEGRRQCGGSH